MCVFERVYLHVSALVCERNVRDPNSVHAGRSYGADARGRGSHIGGCAEAPPSLLPARDRSEGRPSP